MKFKYIFLILTFFRASLHGSAISSKDEQLKQFHLLTSGCTFAYTVYKQNLSQVYNDSLLTSSSVYNKCVEDMMDFATQADEEIKKLISAQGFVKVKVTQAPTLQDFSFRSMQLLTRKRAYKGFLKQAKNLKVKESLQAVINDCDNKLFALLQYAQKISIKSYLKLKDDMEAENCK